MATEVFFAARGPHRLVLISTLYTNISDFNVDDFATGVASLYDRCVVVVGRSEDLALEHTSSVWRMPSGLTRDTWMSILWQSVACV